MKKNIWSCWILVLLLVPMGAQAQINFQQNINLAEAFKRAKAENKYVFVDCSTTWCAPCKWMEANVYLKKQVGEVYNEDFICLRVQMDKTPHDSQQIRDQYNDAEKLEREYHIDAYPTYLFFDQNGKAIHKASGSMSEMEFIALASDAKNPAKQYYTLLKFFKPGTLDTVEEKALAVTFFYSDKELAGKLAADYVSRIPEDVVTTKTTIRLISMFQDSKSMMDIVDDYLDNHVSAPNLDLLLALTNFHHAQTVAQSYINGLSVNNLYRPENLRLMAAFTTSASDRGFDLFYKHSGRVDSLMKNKDFAESTLTSVISRSIVTPRIEEAKKKGDTPDFEQLRKSLSISYNVGLTDRAITAAKMSWYKYLVETKKDVSYWPQLIDAQIELIKQRRFDTLRTPVAALTMNNMCYGWIYLHGTTKDQLQYGISWMRPIAESNAGNTDYLDTYACLLYKDGQIEKALEWESKALNVAEREKSIEKTKQFKHKIGQMKNGEPIWSLEISR